MQGVVFDFDGVLVNSEPLHFRALRECLLPEGIAIDEDEYLREYLAYDDREAIRIALEHHGCPWDGARVDTVARRKAALFEALLRDVPFFPGARELATGLARDVPLGIASGALRAEIEAILSAAGIRDSFTTVVGADDVARSKPHPDPYLAALAGLRRVSPRLQAGDCVAIEDSLPGIAAALAAGLRVVAVAHTYPARKLAAAHLVVDSIAQVGSDELRALCRS
jgi:beta-phosphoglucomutase-like phosphatase (HAD superfamily)